jgi:predicted dehydrogenase
MVRTCREHGVLLMIDHQRRFDRMHRDAVEYVRSGKLGTIQQVTCYYTAGVANTGSHVFDLLRFFFGDVASVRAWPSSNPSPNPADPNYDGWLQFRDGPSTALQACDVKHYVILEINILGEAGRLRIMASGYDAQYEVVRESDKFAGYRELFPAATPFETPTEHEFMLQAMDHLSGCLDRGEPPISTGTDGRASLEIICALHASAAEESRLVTLPLENSRSMIQSR